VLRELLDHDSNGHHPDYYRVGASDNATRSTRSPAPVRPQRQAHVEASSGPYSTAEHARRAVGQVAVPTAPATATNVQAGGGACPFRLRCVGCDHFRTGRLLPARPHRLSARLLRDANVSLPQRFDEWAKAEALPSQEESTGSRI